MEREAVLWEPLEDGAVRCALCAHRCRIAPGRRGICRVRENRDGTLLSLVYGRLVAENPDPIEKKPLYHFLPGTLSHSIATAGCNLSCSHCQNFAISKEAPLMTPIPGIDRTAEQVVETALATECSSISYTYTEPTVFLEFALDCARLAKGRGLANVFVTNGFMTPEAVDLAAPLVDAANVDLKGASEAFYREVCGASLEPVKRTIRELHARSVWVEVTTLLIPGLNDDEPSLREVAAFLADLDPGIPWHVSRFFPTWKMTDRPPTPLSSIERALEAGRKAGLDHVYPGNVHPSRDVTTCRSCGEPLLERSGFRLLLNALTPEGLCPVCGTPFHGVPGLRRRREGEPVGE